MIQEKLQKIQVKRLVILNLPYFFIFYVADKGSWLYRHCLGESMVQRLGVMLVNFRLAFLSWLPSVALQDLAVGVLVAGALKLVVYYRSKNAKKFRQGVEYGSARWGNRKDIEPFMDPVFENNVILTETERLTMNSRPKAPKYARNKNVIVIGGSGSGKTRFYVKPNLMQMTDHVSYVVTDPKGTIIVECGKMLVNGGYRIKVLNTINFKKSMHYNPFHYIRSEKDILKLVNTIIANTKGEGEKSTEDFWVKAERLLYSALIGYIWYEAPEEEQNFSTLLEFINASETREDDEEFKNAVDELFEELEAENPEHFAVRQYRKYKLAAGKTAKSILISCGARLAPFDIQELREIMSYDEMELDMIGDQRTAMFVIISDTDDTFNFVVAIMYTCLLYTSDVTKVKISKQDIAGKELPGAKLTILDQNGKVVESWTSTEKAHYIEMLPIGKYTLREETAPDGYLVAKDVEFEVKDTSVVQHVTMVDEEKPAEKTPEGGKPVSDSPKTGDNTNLWLWFMLLGIGATGTGALAIMRKKKH